MFTWFNSIKAAETHIIHMHMVDQLIWRLISCCGVRTNDNQSWTKNEKAESDCSPARVTYSTTLFMYEFNQQRLAESLSCPCYFLS